MLRRSAVSRWGEAPSVYPYHKPFLRTPYDQDRHKLRQRSPYAPRAGIDATAPPAWLSKGIDGTGHGVGLARHHPLSTLTGNLQQTPENVERIMSATMTGFQHQNGRRLYYRGGKVPQPQMHPYLTGEPCPVHGWKILDHDVTRKFEAPTQDKERVTYRPYVALHEQKIHDMDKPAQIAAGGSPNAPATTDGSTPKKPPAGGGKKDKPLLKRLFFWQ